MACGRDRGWFLSLDTGTGLVRMPLPFLSPPLPLLSFPPSNALATVTPSPHLRHVFPSGHPPRTIASKAGRVPSLHHPPLGPHSMNAPRAPRYALITAAPLRLEGQHSVNNYAKRETERPLRSSRGVEKRACGGESGRGERGEGAGGKPDARSGTRLLRQAKERRRECTASFTLASPCGWAVPSTPVVIARPSLRKEGTTALRGGGRDKKGPCALT